MPTQSRGHGTRWGMAVFAFFVVAVSAVADDVYQQSKLKKTIGTVKQETGLGIILAGPKEKETIPADDIVDIEYEVEPVTVRTTIYRAAIIAEKDSLDPTKEAKHKEHLKAAKDKYEESLAKLGPGQEFAKRNLLFKVGMLNLRQAIDDGTPLDVAVARLTEFKTRYPDSWQISRCLKTLAQLHIDSKKYKEAEATYRDLAAANVPPDVKQEAEILATRVVMLSGKPDVAEKVLQGLAGKLPKGSKHAQRARIVLAECQMAAKKGPEATKALRDVITETTDKSLKAIAYNVLGKSLYDAEKLKEARWEFLWVDTVYNQDKTEHAKALYYLWKVFDKLGETDRAAECRDTLLSDRQFTASDWYRRAKTEGGKVN